MIKGVGTDICDIRRIAKVYGKYGEKFVRKLLTAEEYPKNGKITPSFLAKRFAAKEAVVKALGVAFTDGLFLKDVMIIKNDLGAPYVNLSAKAKARVGNDVLIHLSLSDEKDYALAFAIAQI